MMFVVDGPRLKKMISIVRDDREKKKKGAPPDPFLRMEASGASLKLSGMEVEAEFPATVHEPGVVFLRVTLFRRMLDTFKGEKPMTIQATREALEFGSVRMPYMKADMLLYPDPLRAPEHHPGDRVRAEEIRQAEVREAERKLQESLFEAKEARKKLKALKGQTPPTRGVLRKARGASRKSKKK